jgi:rhodanese-related sulfurtransferase
MTGNTSINAVLRCTWALAGVLMLALALPAHAEGVPDTIDGTTKVGTEKVISLANAKSDLVIIDARKPGDYEEGHIPGAVSVPAGGEYKVTADDLAKHIPAKATPVLFYCNGVECGRSVAAARTAVDAGYKNIYWYRKGWAAYDDSGYPVEK